MIWRCFLSLKKLSLLLSTVARKLTVFVLPVGGSVCYRVLCQKLLLDRRTHLRLQSCGLGRHTAAVSISTNTHCASLNHPEYQTIKKWSCSLLLLSETQPTGLSVRMVHMRSSSLVHTRSLRALHSWLLPRRYKHLNTLLLVCEVIQSSGAFIWVLFVSLLNRHRQKDSTSTSTRVKYSTLCSNKRHLFERWVTF